MHRSACRPGFLSSLIIVAAAITAAATLTLAGTASAAAQDRLAAIAPKPLVEALNEFAAKTGLQIVYRTELSDGILSPGAQGNLPAEQALAQLLRDTGLVYEFINARTVAIRLPGADSGRSGNASTRSLTQSSVFTGSAFSGPANIVLAQASQPSTAASSKSRQEQASESQELPAPEEIRKGIPEVLVEGSKILNMDIPRDRDGPQPWVVFDRAAMERSGANTIEDFLKQRLTMNSQGRTTTQDNGGAILGGSSQINLRGLGLNQTLILIDGRRSAETYVFGSPGQPNLNGIPLSSIERIEVLPSTASGIYGGGATGGVVNVVRRRDYAGAEAAINYDNTFDSDSAVRRLELSLGYNLEDGKTNVLLSGSRSEQNLLQARDRDLVVRGRNHILANGGGNYRLLDLFNFTPPLGSTTNIFSANGSNLVLDNGTSLGSAIAFIPTGYAGRTSDQGAALLQNAGNYNLELANSAQNFIGGGTSLLNAPTTDALLATIRREFSPSLQAYMDFATSNQTTHSSLSPTVGNFTVDGSAPNNPFTNTISVRVPISEFDYDESGRQQDRRVTGGAILKLPREWNASADYTWSRSTWSASRVGLSSAFAAAIRNGTIDVLRDPISLPSDLSQFLFPAGTIVPFRTTLIDSAIRLAGPIGQLPAGNAMLSALLEHRHIEFDDGVLNQTNGYFPGRSQVVDSVYLEATLPIAGEGASLRWPRQLELQIAGRADRYSTEGTPSGLAGPSSTFVRSKNETESVDPTLSIRATLLPELAFRASYGTGFLPPNVGQLSPIVTLGAISVIDPRRGGTATVIPANQSVQRGNPDLNPEQSKSWSAGLIWTPAYLADFRLALDWTSIRKDENIGFLSGQAIVDSESLFPGRVTRGSALPGDPVGWSGPITFLDFTFVNLAQAEIEAYDLSVEYKYDTAVAGSFEIYGNASWQTHYKTKTLPSQPWVENVDITSSNPLKFRGNVTASWNFRNWTSTWSTRYSGSYFVADPKLASSQQLFLQQGSQRVSAQIYHDLSASYRFQPSSSNAFHAKALQNLDIQFGVRNVFNSRPPIDVSNNISFYSYFGEPRLASYWLNVRKGF